MMQEPEAAWADPVRGIVYEHMLLQRVAAQGVAPHGRTSVLERSATVLLARLEAGGPMTIAELAESFDLDVSTVHRQVAAAMKAGLVERIADPGGGPARRHRPTDDGRARLAEELATRRGAVEHVVADWPEEDVADFTRLLRRFNEGAETWRGHPWPRPQD
ncbi:MarR family winged helix-turn-helix transcriptional regulator [Micrococcus sp. EYE_162]|uniref:MarR family winged helix-turn-helix transcriptional regulator n=1 Tax=unclassified Micrococcus TaxID=2620948 RepID=UPI00200671C6|nr:MULTISPECIES: MarR family winged helix-turn-helix transcriptional regulator [unclassified Micrococcus]MCK6095093.1 MarR family winged helix-turn-helix transcriptional regulator [Micrococcus sp. EYE_212]MCK6171040.1 MarR family winged helix-turn-helix transcriptional regulator [Micrococcus sp. EYE_162]